jgi:heme-degrading monooxygenase HmoA
VIYEVVEMTIDPDKRDEYVKVYRDAWKKADFAGSHGGKVMCAMDDPSKVVVIIAWDSLDAHRQHTRPRPGTPEHIHFRETIHPYMTETSVVHHYEIQELTD